MGIIENSLSNSNIFLTKTHLPVIFDRILSSDEVQTRQRFIDITHVPSGQPHSVGFLMQQQNRPSNLAIDLTHDRVFVNDGYCYSPTTQRVYRPCIGRLECADTLTACKKITLQKRLKWVSNAADDQEKELRAYAFIMLSGRSVPWVVTVASLYKVLRHDDAASPEVRDTMVWLRILVRCHFIGDMAKARKFIDSDDFTCRTIELVNNKLKWAVDFEPLHDADEKVIAAAVPCGGGKTSSLARYYLFDKYDSGLYIAPFQAILAATQHTFSDEAAPVWHYMKDKGTLKASQIGIRYVLACINSAPQRHLSKLKPDVLVLDEITQLLDALLGSQCADTDRQPDLRFNIYRALYTLIKRAKQVVIMDAFLTPQHLRTFCDLFDILPDSCVVGVCGHDEALYRTTLACTHSERQFLADPTAAAIKRLHQGENVAIFCGSPSDAYLVRQRISDAMCAPIETLLVIGDRSYGDLKDKRSHRHVTKRTDIAKKTAFLEDPNGYIRSHQPRILLYNTAMCSSVSIEVDHFAHVIAMVRPKTYSTDQLIQAMLRSRLVLTFDIYIKVASTYFSRSANTLPTPARAIGDDGASNNPVRGTFGFNGGNFHRSNFHRSNDPMRGMFKPAAMQLDDYVIQQKNQREIELQLFPWILLQQLKKAGFLVAQQEIYMDAIQAYSFNPSDQDDATADAILSRSSQWAKDQLRQAAMFFHLQPESVSRAYVLAWINKPSNRKLTSLIRISTSERPMPWMMAAMRTHHTQITRIEISNIIDLLLNPHLEWLESLSTNGLMPPQYQTRIAIERTVQTKLMDFFLEWSRWLGFTSKVATLRGKKQAVIITVPVVLHHRMQIKTVPDIAPPKITHAQRQATNADNREQVRKLLERGIKRPAIAKELNISIAKTARLISSLN